MTTNGNPASVAADLAASYRLGLAELEKLRDALAPAFALGLQQALESPARWPELSRLFLAGPWPMRDAKAGDNLLDLFFVSPALRDAVSRQASTLTGLAPAVVAEMMPRLAALGVEAMMRGAMGQGLSRPASGLPADEIGRLTAEMMRRGANAVEALSTPAGTPPARPAAVLPASPFQVFDLFGEAMRATLGAAPWPGSSAPRPAVGGFDPQAPFAAMFEAFAKGMRSAAAATGAAGAPNQAPAGPEARPPEPGAAPDPHLLEAFLAPGRRIQESYVREMTDLFRRFPGASRDGPA